MLEKALINCTIDKVLNQLKDNNRIDDAYIQEFRKGNESQNLVIGVVGKMKAGKSSLVNAAVFADEILPSGSEPITVTLTEVSYSVEGEGIEVELLSLDDINDLKEKAKYDGSDKLLKEKADEASHTIESLPSDYDKIIANKKNIVAKLSELEEFVSSSGRYSGLAKFVKIKIKNESLKGITIIDTPGFNDPISSRGETTRNCLSRCNVILFVHNQDGYDQVDESLLKEQIEYAGISEIIDVYNKVDLLNMSFDEWDEQKEYFIEKRDEYVENMNNNSNIYSIISKAESILTSSLMALCGLIPSEKRTDWLKQSRSRYEEEYDELCEISETESTDDLFIKYSNINSLIDKINQIGRNSANYLLEAPLATLKGKLDSIVEILKIETSESEARIASYESNIAASKSELDSLLSHMSEVSEKIKVYPLEDRLHAHENQTKKDLCSNRSNRSSSEFSEENYPETKVFSSGINKQNVANYNSFITNFSNEIRDAFGAYTLNGGYGLVGAFRNEINDYVRKIKEMLVSSQISAERRDLFEQALLKKLNTKLGNINVDVKPIIIQTTPTGTQKNWSLYKTSFEDAFDDEYFDGLLAQFRQMAKEISSPEIAIGELVNLRNEIMEILSSTPAQKEIAKQAEREKVAKLSNELKLYNAMVQQIKQLLKSK